MTIFIVAEAIERVCLQVGYKCQLPTKHEDSGLQAIGILIPLFLGIAPALQGKGDFRTHESSYQRAENADAQLQCPHYVSVQGLSLPSW